ncbi:MAG: hypothetical protein L6R42_002031 [Xanthoria sp. 1 TBL-2021]|nr:MAG: hypothetical protein L6R42_002031 [Xanthoria sp. 1 TBL-2021]
MDQRHSNVAVLNALLEPSPPLPPQKYGNRAASAIARFAQPFIYASRPPSAHGDLPSSSRELETRSNAQRSARTTTHKTGLPIDALDISPGKTHAILAGREILKTIRVTETACTEDFNLRSNIIAYAAAHDSSGGIISARHKDQLTATDVKWSHGSFDTRIATAATSGQIVIYDINRAGVELARLHEHSRQVHTIAFNPFEGGLLLSGSQDSTVRLWDLRVSTREGSVTTCQSTHKYPGNSEGIRDLRWSPAEGFEFAIGTDNGVVQRWDIRRPDAQLLRINAHEKTCYSIDWHPDGKHLASGGADKSVRVWDFSSNDRRMNPCWQLRTPQAVHNLRWRPTRWKAEEGAPGHWDSTQLATSYDNRDPRTHIWDLRRPAVPSREINRYETAPTAILWHSESLLWSVGNAGMFTQTDLKSAKKVSDKQSPSTIATAPDGSFALFLEGKFKEKGGGGELRHEFHQRHRRAGSTGDKLSTSFSAAEGSFEESSLLGSSFRSRRRKAPSTRSSRSLASTPPPGDTGGPTTHLNELMHRDDPLRLAQKAGCGGIRGVIEAEAFIFLACHYESRVPMVSGPGKTVLDSLSEALSHNADSATYVGQFRLAQSWRIFALALQKELLARANRNCARRSLQPKRLSRDEGSAWSINTTPKITGDRRSTTGSQSGPANGPRKLPTTVSVDGGSNMSTPLVRPVPNAIAKSAMLLERDELDGHDSLVLPEPRFRKRSPQKPVEKTSALSRLRSPNDDDENAVKNVDSANAGTLQDAETLPQDIFYDIDRHMTERRATMQNYRTTPRPVLRLEDSVQTLENHPLVPRFDRHDSNESFQMFSASTDSSHIARSVLSSFASSQGSGSSGPIPERWDVARHQHSLQDSKGSSAPHESQDSSPSPMILQLERPTTITRILHEEDTYTGGQASHGEDRRNEGSEETIFTDSDFRPSTHDPPPAFWSATGMLGPLINYHLQQLSDVQLPAHILLVIGSYIKHDVPDALVSSIFLDYHTQLTSKSLYAQAARLRKSISARVPDVAGYGTYEIDTGGPWCTACKKPSKGDRGGFCSRCQQSWASCPICDGDDPLSSLGEYAFEEAAAVRNEGKCFGECNWGWCQDCGHGGHVICLRAWWDDTQASEGGCPTFGCLHDCVAGSRRAAVHQRKADTEKASAVKGDTWVVGESRAVGRTRSLMGTAGKEGLVVQDHMNNRSSTVPRGSLSMAAMGRTGSGGKKRNPNRTTSLDLFKDRISTTPTKTKLPPLKLTTTDPTRWRTKKATSSICTSTSLLPRPLPTWQSPVPSINLRCSYVPRKCSATNRIIKAKDHASVQISVGKVDENGRYTGENQVYALCGFVRAMGEGDDSLNRLAQRDGMLKGVWSGQKMR